MRHLLIALFLMATTSVVFAKKYFWNCEHNTKGYPYWELSKIKGFEDQLITPAPFAGAPEAEQIVWRMIKAPDNFVFALSPEGHWRKNKVIYTGDRVYLQNFERKVIGSDVVQAGEGYWQPVIRILTTDSLRYKDNHDLFVATLEVDATRMESDEEVYEKNFEKVKQQFGAWFSMLFWLFKQIFLLCVVAMCLLWFMGKASGN